MTDAANLPHVSASQVFTKWRGGLVNDVFDLIRDRGVPSPGQHQSGEGLVNRQRPFSKDGLSWIQCVSDDDVPPFGIVEVYDGKLTISGVILRVRKAQAGAIMFAGNEDYELFADNFGWVKLITPYEPVRVSVSNSSDEFEFGDLLSVSDLKVIKGSNRLLRAITPYPNSTEWGTGTGTSDNDDEHTEIIGIGLQLPARFKLIPGGGAETGTGTGSPGDDEPAYVIRPALGSSSTPLGGLRLKDEEPDPDYPDPELIYYDFIRNVFALGEHVWCEQMPDGKWQIYDDGWSSGKGSVEAGSGGPTYNVTISFRHPVFNSTIDVVVPAESFDSSLSYPDGGTVLLRWDYGARKFYIDTGNCGNFVFIEPEPIVPTGTGDDFSSGTGFFGTGSGSFP